MLIAFLHNNGINTDEYNLVNTCIVALVFGLIYNTSLFNIDFDHFADTYIKTMATNSSSMNLLRMHHILYI